MSKGLEALLLLSRADCPSSTLTSWRLIELVYDPFMWFYCSSKTKERLNTQAVTYSTGEIPFQATKKTADGFITT